MAQMPVTITGNLTTDPELVRFRSGKLQTRLRVASSRSRRSKDTGDWEDIDQLFLDVRVWGLLAVNTHATLRKGMPIIATGWLVTDSWEDDRGKHYSTYLRGARVALDLARCVAVPQASTAIPSREQLAVDRDLSEGVADQPAHDFAEMMGVPA